MPARTDLPAPRTSSLPARLLEFRRQIERIDTRLARIFVPWAVRHPRHLPRFLRMARAHAEARQIRALELAGGLRVPPFLILSVTSRCNLRCAGCFAGAVGTVAEEAAQPGLDLDAWRKIVDEAIALGVMGFVIAGGEPFLLPDLASLFHEHPDRLFLVFTNGTALEDRDYVTLKRYTNTAVVVSLEGDRDLTDLRRGSGVYGCAMESLHRLRRAGVLTGIAVTVGSDNVEYWTEPEHIDAVIAHSGPLAFFIEQIPAGECRTAAPLTAGQRARFRETIVRYRERASGGAYIIHSPDDEESLGGCVSAGRGFAHVNPGGDVTACPVSALATHNVTTSSLREALASPLFSMIRANGHLLETAGHPCALFAHAEELEKMARGTGAYRTGETAGEGRVYEIQSCQDAGGLSLV